MQNRNQSIKSDAGKWRMTDIYQMTYLYRRNKLWNQ